MNHAVDSGAMLSKSLMVDLKVSCYSAVGSEDMVMSFCMCGS